MMFLNIKRINIVEENVRLQFQIDDFDRTHSVLSPFELTMV